MRVETLAIKCGDKGCCPAVHRLLDEAGQATDKVVIVGTNLTPDELTQVAKHIGPAEVAVKINPKLLTEAVAKLTG